MTNKFTVNGKEYKAKAFDFNMVVDLEEMGVSLAESAKKPMSMVRTYFAICSGLPVDVAGKEIEQHIINGGKLDDVMLAMSKEMEESDFFRSLTKNA